MVLVMFDTQQILFTSRVSYLKNEVDIKDARFI